MENVRVWMRLGVSLNLTKEQAKMVLDGDAAPIMAVLKKPRGFMGLFRKKKLWYIDGDSYIPFTVAEELCEELGLNPRDYKFDIDFDLSEKER